MNSCNIYCLNFWARGGKVSLVTSKEQTSSTSLFENGTGTHFVPRQYPGRNENIDAFGKLQQLHFEEECAEKVSKRDRTN